MNEFKKIFKKKSHIFVIVIFVICACFPFLFNQNLNHTDYSQFYQQIKNDSQTQVKKKLDELKNKRNKYQLLEEESLKEGEELRQIDSLLNQLQKEYEVAYDYDQWLNNQIEGQKDKSQISIFQQENGFQTELNHKNYDAYKNLDIKMNHTMQPSYGIELWLDNVFVDFLLILFSIYCIIFIYIQEEKSGFLNFMRIQYNGRKKLFFSKIFSLYLYNFIIIIILYGMTGIILASQYGIPILSQPCQSLYLFKESVLPLSVWQMLGVVILCKWIVLNFYTTLLQFFAEVFKNIFVVVGLFSALQILIIFISNFIYESSSIFYFLKLTQLFHPEKYIKRLSCINIFNHAVEYIWLIVFIIILTIIFVFICFQLFKFYFRKTEFSFHLKRRNIFHKIGYFEIKKIYQSCFGGLLLGVILLLLFGYVSSIKDVTFSQDILYNHYIDYISEKVNEKTFGRIDKEKERFEELSQRLLQETNEKVIIDINAQLQYKDGLLRYEKRANEILDSHKDINIIKEDQVRFVFEDDFVNSFTVFSILLSITGLCYFMKEKEEQSRVILLQKCSGNYNKIKKLQKKYIFYFCVLLLFFIKCIIIVKNILMYKGQWLTFQTSEYTLLFSFPIQIPIFLYLIIEVMYQGILIYLIIQLMYFIYNKISNIRLVLLVSLFIFGIFSFDMSSFIQNITYFQYIFYPRKNIYVIFIIVGLFLIKKIGEMRRER